MKYTVKRILLICLLGIVTLEIINGQGVPKEFMHPPREYSVFPFWFWNDTLKDEEITRQISDFEAHGVYGFVIHPRIGLPESMSWLSAEMIHFMNVAISEAARRKMYVVLYDEGMYPSGSSSGQVVARNPKHAARGLAKIDLRPGENLQLTGDKNLITIINRPGGARVAIVDQPSGGVIRGLHYIGEGGNEIKEEIPPAGDILNPDAVTSFMDLVYERYAKEFGKYFGTTILGIFTDEPSPLGRNSINGMIPGNTSLLNQISSIIGYNIKPFLADLWYNDSRDSKKHREDYNRAINICLEENYYKRLGDWCKAHGISLMGHPAQSMDIGAERYFGVPGQDLVWRYVEPGPKSLEGQHSTMAKCASSAMVHLGLRRNSNELYGAYGHNLTYDEMKWLADWCFVRGQNLLFPHAFFYSVRGPRLEERPPDVGPHSSWWNSYKSFADACSRMSWLNTDSRQICDVAILCESAWLPDKPAKICYQHQRDFNYLEIRDLYEKATVDSKGIHIAGMDYSVMVIDSISSITTKAKPLLKKLARSGRLIICDHPGYASMFKGAIVYKTANELIISIDKIVSPDLDLITPSENIRYRHVVKGTNHYYILFNEGAEKTEIRFITREKGDSRIFDPVTMKNMKISGSEMVSFKPHEMKILLINNYFKIPPI